jgi:N-acetyl-anhydromuramyl-L-alanine amidase AmpD
MARSGSSGRSKHRSKPLASRAGVVWVALIGAMTGVGGLMWALDGSVAPRMDGVALPALVASAGPTSLESIFNTRAPIADAKWDAIVIHHSASPVGSPATIEAQHKAMNFQGLGYHFVIGNGTGTDDGELYVGYRWRDQLPGAHVAGPKGDALNRTSIGICMVGDGRRKPFTEQQMRRLTQLVTSLMEKCGIPADHVYLHSDVAETADPGRFFPVTSFREQLRAAR